MTAPIIAGAEPGSWDGGPNGVLVLHGFTGNPQSMRPLAEAIAAAGYTVEMPLLPGHGTALEDMIPTRWSDWSQAAQQALAGLQAKCEATAVAGLSMGGTLSTWLAATHPEIKALVTVNAAVEPNGDALIQMCKDLLAAGTEVLPAIGSDIANPEVTEAAYDGAPVAALQSMAEAVESLAPLIPGIHCPALIFTSTQDHVVPPTGGAYLADHLGGPVEQVRLERSYHVATLDYDAEEIQTRTIDFLAKAFTA